MRGLVCHVGAGARTGRPGGATRRQYAHERRGSRVGGLFRRLRKPYPIHSWTDLRRGRHPVGLLLQSKFSQFQRYAVLNQSKDNSDFQSLTNSSGVAATANFFTGSHFPGSVSYRYDYNSTGTFGLASTPNFTTQGNGQGFGVNWSALLPDWPTLSVGYQQGSGSSTLYGTDQEASSDQRLFNVRSSYRMAGFNFNAFYDHTSLDSVYPEFLVGAGNEKNDSSGQDMGINTSRNIDWWHGSMYASFDHSSYSTDYLSGTQQNSTNSSYSADQESAGVNF